MIFLVDRAIPYQDVNALLYSGVYDLTGHSFRASIPEVVGSIPTLVGQNSQPAQYGFHSRVAP